MTSESLDHIESTFALRRERRGGDEGVKAVHAIYSHST